MPAMIEMTHTHESLQALVGRALVDPSFRKDLLNGHRADCLAEYDLTREERRAAGAIQASDLTSFARQLDGWISDRAHSERQATSVAAPRRMQLAALAA
jgi:hypothetical protein